MSERYNGGPAFPAEVGPGCSEVPTGPATWRMPGMTLREWFAGQVLLGLVSDGEWQPDDYFATTAETAFKLADAMLAERAKTVPR